MVSVPSTYRVRAPAVAGSFYPGDADELARLVDNLLDTAVAGPHPQARAVIAPHAGYVYSGAVAAAAFACLRAAPGRFRRAAVIGPSHFWPFQGLAAPSCAAFATPLGTLPVDRDSIEALAAEDLVVIDDEAHRSEHAIEVELPFLQRIFGEIPIVPLLFGTAAAERLADAIARLWHPDMLLVVSSDLSHYEPYRSAQIHDARTAAAIENFDQAAIGPYEACGHLALRGMLMEAVKRRLVVERLDLRNSGDTAGDRARVVGYGAWVLSAPVQAG